MNDDFYSFRIITKDDYDFLREMLYIAVFVPPDEPLLDKSIIDLPEIAKYIENWGLCSDFGFVVENNNEPVGAIWGRLFTKSKKGYGFIDEKTPELSMALKPEYQNQGLGSQLMKRFLDYARFLGHSALSLSVAKRNRAVKFYKKHDFSVIRETENDYLMKIIL